jgi:hypothetical protein
MRDAINEREKVFPESTLDIIQIEKILEESMKLDLEFNFIRENFFEELLEQTQLQLF